MSPTSIEDILILISRTKLHYANLVHSIQFSIFYLVKKQSFTRGHVHTISHMFQFCSFRHNTTTNTKPKFQVRKSKNMCECVQDIKSLTNLKMLNPMVLVKFAYLLLFLNESAMEVGLNTNMSY